MFVKKVLKYAFSHNVQQLDVKCLDDNYYIEFPPLFRSQSLKRLSITGFVITITSTWELPELTTLYLDDITVYSDTIGIFSNCANLKNLMLHDCNAPSGFNIYHSRLSNLTIEYVDYECKVNVVTPQLKNLSIKDGCEIDQSLQISADSVRLLEKVDLICFPSGLKLINLLLCYNN